jgi:hypothetical protein
MNTFVSHNSLNNVKKNSIRIIHTNQEKSPQRSTAHLSYVLRRPINPQFFNKMIKMLESKFILAILISSGGYYELSVIKGLKSLPGGSAFNIDSLYSNA